MTEILDALKSALLPLIPGLVGALVAAGIAWLGRLKLLAHVREEIAQSAVRQALDLHGDSVEADQAAADELHRMSDKVRPKDVIRAVRVARERVVSASQPPPPGIARPIELPPPDKDAPRL